jgi:hypothetical protein
MKRDAELFGELRSQLPRLGCAAAVLFFAARRTPQAHGRTNDFITLLYEQSCCY